MQFFLGKGLTSGGGGGIIDLSRGKEREVTTMKKATMIRHYRKHSAADSYIVGFTYANKLYAIKLDEIMPRLLKEDTASRGAGSLLRLSIKKCYKEQLIRKGAICFGSQDILNTEKYNKGEIFEKIITEHYNQTWEKDTVPFWEDGDITVDGEKIQIKLDRASLLNEKQIRKNFYKRG